MKQELTQRQGLPGWVLTDLRELPFIDARPLACVTGRPRSEVYGALKDQVEAGLVGRVRHGTVHLPEVGRNYLTSEGIAAASAALNLSVSEFLRAYPVSKEWTHLIIGRMDAVAGIYSLAAALSPGADELRTHVRFHRKGNLCAKITLHDGKTFGIVRQGRALRRRSLRDRLMRLWQYGHHTDALLVLTPSPWEASLVARWGEERGYSGAYVTAESATSLTRRDARVWQRVNSATGGTRTLSEIIDETLAYGGYTAESQSRTRASLPSLDRLVQRAPTFSMTRADKFALEIITAHPQIPRTHLFEWLGVSESGGSQIVRRLQDRWGLVERDGVRGEYRYTLTLAGIRYITARDRAQLTTTRGIWSTTPLAVPDGDRQYEGLLIDTWKSRTEHTNGITWWLSRLAAEARDHPDTTLLWWVPEAWTERVFHWRELAIEPDAIGELVTVNGGLFFFLEYEKRAKYRSGIQPKIERYQHYYNSFDTGGDLPSEPVALFVVDTESVADRYVQTVREDPDLRLPILVSSMPELARTGILGRAWRPLWDPDAATVRLADVAGYSWNRRQRRMERRP